MTSVAAFGPAYEAASKPSVEISPDRWRVYGARGPTAYEQIASRVEMDGLCPNGYKIIEARATDSGFKLDGGRAYASEGIVDCLK